MGYGDHLMTAGMAEELYNSDPSLGPILIVDSNKAPRWQPLWLDNPAIVQPNGQIHSRYLLSGKGHLPYIVNPYSVATGWIFTDWRARDHRGHIYLTDQERLCGTAVEDRVGPYVLLEPTAPRKHINRRPAPGFWDTLASQLAAVLPYRVVQLSYPESYLLRLAQAPHKSFREACGILANAELLITTEGGLAHAAAALGTSAVVLWGGNISCENLGYPEHRNLVDDAPQSPCGALHACDHCSRAWAKLDVASVVDAVLQELPAYGVSRSRHDPHWRAPRA